MSEIKNGIRFSSAGASPRTPLGAYSAPTDPLSRFKGPTGKGERKGMVGGKREGNGEERGEEGTAMGWFISPMFEILKNTVHATKLLRENAELYRSDEAED